MAKQRVKRVLSSTLVSISCLACTPTRDLDATSAGNAQSGGARTSASVTSGETQAGGATTLGSSGVGGYATAGSTPVGGGGNPASGGAALLGGAFTGGGTPAAGGTEPGTGGAAGSGGTEPGTGGTLATAVGGTSSAATGGAPPPTGGSNTTLSLGGTASSGGATSAVITTGGQSIQTGGVGNGGTVAATGGLPTTGGTRSTSSIAPDLGDLIDAPVEGFITYSTTASWDIGRVQREAFRIETPTATYFVVKSVAAITSLVDANNVPWVLYNTGYRTHRGIPNLGGCCQPDPPTAQPTMTTVHDPASATSSHLRLVSKPTDGDYYWVVWDFYLTHVTITINRSPSAFGFTYDGVPGNTLDGNNDHLVLSTGEVKSSKSYFNDDLAGPAEWAYITNGETEYPGSLFLIQHTDDNLPETYSVPDGDGSRFTFGSGQLTTTPIRFSLGLIDSTAHAAVSERVEYIIQNTPP